MNAHIIHPAIEAQRPEPVCSCIINHVYNAVRTSAITVYILTRASCSQAADTRSVNPANLASGSRKAAAAVGLSYSRSMIRVGGIAVGMWRGIEFLCSKQIVRVFYT